MEEITPDVNAPDPYVDPRTAWSISRGNVRAFVEDAVPPISEEAQRTAGEAAAIYGLNAEQLASGLDSVSGSVTGVGDRRISIPDPDIPVDHGAAAFFDVDNTLIQGSSLAQLAFGLAKRRFFRLRDIGPIVWKQAKFMITGTEDQDDVEASRQLALDFIKGHSEQEIIDLGNEIIDSSMLNKVYPGTRELAQLHLNAGQQVWLVSATPVQLAQLLAKRLGFTGALGTVPEVRDGIFTGRLVGDILHGPGKKHAVAALASLDNLDLARCTAYSDSANDIPMLSMVGTAVAINPDKKLKAEAEKRNWIIRDYRSVRRVARLWVIPIFSAIAGAALWSRFKKSGNKAENS